MAECEKLKVGVFGVGALGRHHARLYAQSPNAEVVGIFDVNKETAEKVGAEFGLKVFDDWKELAEQCEAMSVAVPANYHASRANMFWWKNPSPPVWKRQKPWSKPPGKTT